MFSADGGGLQHSTLSPPTVPPTAASAALSAALSAAPVYKRPRLSPPPQPQEVQQSPIPSECHLSRMNSLVEAPSVLSQSMDSVNTVPGEEEVSPCFHYLYESL